jgi:hypothetical protein
VADSYDQYQQNVVADLINHSVVARADPPLSVTAA